MKYLKRILYLFLVTVINSIGAVLALLYILFMPLIMMLSFIITGDKAHFLYIIADSAEYIDDAIDTIKKLLNS